ncbi:regulator of chromosome condensation (RCC1) repeat domain-containing protein [Sarocladium implicatum]|nr:regulator of chromosome condensation (RCC1) repeat domain-containing protein [Sarocladium implicatum]
MSHLLWKYYWENDVDRFRRLLAPPGQISQSVSKSPGISTTGGFLGAGSPGAPATSPRNGPKPRKTSSHFTPGKTKDGNTGPGKSEVNSRDHAGLTILLRAASSTASNAADFVSSLLAHPAIDIYVQDPESGWNALHRSLYTGNISIARLLLEKERADLSGHNVALAGKVGHLIKTKDHEGNSPFDVYNSTIATRSLKQAWHSSDSDAGSDSDEEVDSPQHHTTHKSEGFRLEAHGEEIFMFGSNKNLSLGVGDEDDRQYPERIQLTRPDQLIQRFYQSYLDFNDMDSSVALPDLENIPNLVRSRPLVIRDVVMSKLHTAILTSDPVSNLYVCGVGRGGRLGLGDENTQFKFVPVQGPFEDKRITQIALGQNHSIAVVGNGELWTWGLNSDSQLGYVLPTPVKNDEEPMSLSPRQVFGILKKEVIVGVAASAVHSVAHTGSAMYTWGRNNGQLALMDADSRSLDVQQTPRKVAASLLTAPIEMVSAIDRATTCLLSNFSVWVFTNYGYNLVKFPIPDVFTNHNLATTSFSNRYDSGRRDICYITSGDDTIAAVTARGDLFTMHLNHKADASHLATSTTNPVKMKSAVTPPQCIWDARKDGVASVGVGEHGSVIICTESGAVWRRVKRAKGKNAGFVGSSDIKRKDFKFERVPYITNCVAVRSSIYGAFAALRSDSRVMTTDIHTNEKSLWDDVRPLLCLNDFEAADVPEEKAEAAKRWKMAISKERPGSVSYEILRARDLETELKQFLEFGAPTDTAPDLLMRTSSLPDLQFPVHGWILSARSTTLRRALSIFRMRGLLPENEHFSIETEEGRPILTLNGVDVLTLLNIVVCAYHDVTVPVWKYTREAPSQAARFRQVRNEVMKLATNLQMLNLEASARLQATMQRSLDDDLQEAVTDQDFFDDGDVVLELDGADVLVHSGLVCQRCPFFEGMFHGRSQGQWLAGRRDELIDAEKVRVDLKHVSPETFRFVLEHMYADTGSQMFNDVAVGNIDDFCELVVDVMGVANELMLDRLSQICQLVIGKFVTTRNISNLLNEISPCSVTSFKDVGLEYICLQLESMLENHLLDGLDEDLIHELDDVVRDNQLCCLPFARSGRADMLMHEENPNLAMDIEEERRLRVKEMAYKIAQRDDEKKLSSSFKTRFGSLEEAGGSPSLERSRRKSRTGRNEPFSPSLRPKKSMGDLMFDMDEDDASGVPSPVSPAITPNDAKLDLEVDSIQLPQTSRQTGSRGLEEGSRNLVASPSASEGNTPEPGSLGTTLLERPTYGQGKSASPWAAASLQTSKLDLKGIMTETTSKSALTSSLAAQKAREDAKPKPLGQNKMSQKERKRQLQLQAEAQAAAQEEMANRVPWEKVGSGSKPAPWKAASPASKTSLKDAMAADSSKVGSLPGNTKPLVASETNPKSASRRTASPDTRFPGQSRTMSSPAVTQGTGASSAPGSQPKSKPLIPHSKSYMTPAPKYEQEIGASMTDIIGQQAREQELVKEAVAKRSLQEIQQEQAFQEWWDQESRRAQEEEARRQVRAKGRDDRGGGSAKRGGRGRGKGKARAGEGAAEAAQQMERPAQPQATAGGSLSGRGRGRGKGRGRGGS